MVNYDIIHENKHLRTEECGGHIEPDFHREWRQEGEELGYFFGGLLEKYADTKVHEGHCEIHSFFADIRDCQVRDRQVSFLLITRKNYIRNC